MEQILLVILIGSLVWKVGVQVSKALEAQSGAKKSSKTSTAEVVRSSTGKEASEKDESTAF